MSFWDDPHEFYRQQRQREQEKINSDKEGELFLAILVYGTMAALFVAFYSIVIAKYILTRPNIHYIASFVFFNCIGIDLLYCGYVNSFDFSNCYDSYAFSTNATINILMLITFIHTLFLFKKIRRQAIKFHIISIVLAVMIQFFLH